MKRTNKNGAIELLRFFFASGVVFVHSVSDLFNGSWNVGHIGTVTVSLFKNGNIGVEFFFVISGFFMAKSIYRELEITNNKPIGHQTVMFLKKKINPIFPYYLLACIMTGGVYVYEGDIVLDVLGRLPSVLFLQNTGGFEKSFVTIAWYISAMLIAMAILYPICKCFYYSFTSLYAPLFGILIIGTIVHNTGTLGNATEWAVITYKSNFRAVSEVALGTTCFEISRRIETKAFSVLYRIILSSVAFICFALTFLYINCDLTRRFDPYILLLICVGITITLSNAGLIGQKGIMQNFCFYYLGKISLPLYLFHNVIRYLAPTVLSNLSPDLQCIVIYFGSVGLSVMVDSFVTFCLRRRNRQTVL